MLLKRARLLAVIAGAAGLLWACAGLKISHSAPDKAEADGRAAVAGLVSDYQDRLAEPFFRRFDQERFPNYEGFRNDTRQFLLRVRQISIQMIVDRALSSGDGVAVDAHWNRSLVGRTGGTKVSQGTCSFIFTRSPSGALLLASIRGQSPF